MNVPSVLLSAIEKSINRYLALDPVALKRLGNFNDKLVAIELRGLDLCFHLRVVKQGVQVCNDVPENIDTWIIGTPVSLLKMGLTNEAKDTENLLFAGDVEIKGDLELGQELKTIFNEVDIDLEEQLSKITGDVIAHQVGNLARAGKKWARKSSETIEQDIAEYLQQESNQLPLRDEVEEFLSEVDQLRSAVDRLEARVKRLPGDEQIQSNNQ